jgi:hypothetical protein
MIERSRCSENRLRRASALTRAKAAQGCAAEKTIDIRKKAVLQSKFAFH